MNKEIGENMRLRKNYSLLVIVAIITSVLLYSSWLLLRETKITLSMNANGGEHTGARTITLEKGMTVFSLHPNNENKKEIDDFFNIYKEGYVLENFYIDPSFNVEFDPEQILNESITIYAKWREATPYEMLDENGLILLDAIIRIVDKEHIQYTEIISIYSAVYIDVRDGADADFIFPVRMYYIQLYLSEGIKITYYGHEKTGDLVKVGPLSHFPYETFSDYNYRTKLLNALIYYYETEGHYSF